MLAPGSLVQVHGEVRAGARGLEIAVREHELLARARTARGCTRVGIVPGLRRDEHASRRALLHELVDASTCTGSTPMPEPLPATLRVARHLPLRRDALAALHAPRNEDEPRVARRRLAYEELLLLQLALLRRRRALDAAAPA